MPVKINKYNVKVVGVTFNNTDGKSRQEIIRKCRVGEVVHLIREPKNTFDKNAIAVLTEREEQIGYISKDLAVELAPRFDAREPYAAEIFSLQGGGETEKKERLSYGCNIIIKFGGRK